MLLISRLKFKKIFSQRHNQLKCFCQIIVRSTIKVLRIFETQTTITILLILHELYITWVSPKHKDLSRDLMSRTAAQKTSELFEHTYYTQTATKMAIYCPQGSGTLHQHLLMMHGSTWNCMVLHGMVWYCMVL